MASGAGFTLWVPVRRALPERPEILIQPRAQTVVAGGTVALAAVTTGYGVVHRWRRNGEVIRGAFEATYLLSEVQAASAGSYTVEVENLTGRVTSEPVELAVVNGGGRSQIANLAIRSRAGGGNNTLIVGLAVGGAGTAGQTPVLVRAVGPSLAGFGVSGALGDPRLDFFSGATPLLANEDWGGSGEIAAAMREVGAFVLPAGSKDAVLRLPALGRGAYTAAVGSGDGSSGIALAEIYAAGIQQAGTATTPRLINVSARTAVGRGEDVLIAGFVIEGDVPKTVLVRAVGPGLAGLSVRDGLSDPKLELFSKSGKVFENDDWFTAGSMTMVGAFARAGAFSLPNLSRDAACVVTLPPGDYTAQVSGVNGTTGTALVEVYEIP